MSGAEDDTSARAVNGNNRNSTERNDIEESEALEELIREETKRQLEAAWAAQQRLARACFAAGNTVSPKDKRDFHPSSEDGD